MFTMLVVMALVTTAMTGPLIDMVSPDPRRNAGEAMKNGRTRKVSPAPTIASAFIDRTR
jgi:hypothetical protein